MTTLNITEGGHTIAIQSSIQAGLRAAANLKHPQGATPLWDAMVAKHGDPFLNFTKPKKPRTKRAVKP